MFEALVNAIACQQLSLTVGIHLLNRLSDHFGPTGPSGHTGFPAPAQLAGSDPDSLRPLGFSGSKARAICSLAFQVASGELQLENLDQVGDQEVLAVLLGIRGVGRWSAEYTLLGRLGRLQVLPGDDVGARNNLRGRFNLATSAGYDEVTGLSRSWWPYGSLGVLPSPARLACRRRASNPGSRGGPPFCFGQGGSWVRTAVHGMPRIGEGRALKWALEDFWSGRVGENELRAAGAAIRHKNWRTLAAAGIDFVPSNDFSFYDRPVTGPRP